MISSRIVDWSAAGYATLYAVAAIAFLFVAWRSRVNSHIPILSFGYVWGGLAVAILSVTWLTHMVSTVTMDDEGITGLQRGTVPWSQVTSIETRRDILVVCPAKATTRRWEATLRYRLGYPVGCWTAALDPETTEDAMRFAESHINR